MSITLGVHAKIENPFSTVVTTPSRTTQATGSTFVAFGFGDVMVVTDSFSNTWINPAGAGVQTDFNSGAGSAVCAYVQNALGGAGHTFTLTHGGGGIQLVVLELIGAALSGGPNAFATANVDNASETEPNIITPSITTTVAGAGIAACTGGGSSNDVVPTFANGALVESISSSSFVTGAVSWFLDAVAGAATDTHIYTAQTFVDMAAFTIAFAPAAAGGASSVALERSRRGSFRGMRI